MVTNCRTNGSTNFENSKNKKMVITLLQHIADCCETITTIFLFFAVFDMPLE